MLLLGHSYSCSCHCVSPWVTHRHATFCETLTHTLSTVCYPKICTCHCVWLIHLHTQLVMVCDSVTCTHWPLCVTLSEAWTCYCVWDINAHTCHCLWSKITCTCCCVFLSCHRNPSSSAGSKDSWSLMQQSMSLIIALSAADIECPVLEDTGRLHVWWSCSACGVDTRDTYWMQCGWWNG